MKHIYKLLIIIVVLLSLIIYIRALKYEQIDSIKYNTLSNKFTSTGDEMVEIQKEQIITSKEQINSTDRLGYMYKVGNEKANLFSFSYLDNNLDIGSKLLLKDEKNYVSDQIYLLFRESYPNVSLKKMGVASVEEAYMIVQLAIWEISTRTGESIYADELSRIESIKEDLGTKEIPAHIYERAKKLVELVENYSNNEKNIKNDINFLPTLVIKTLDLNKNQIELDDSFMMGPYKYTVEAGIIDNMEIDLCDENGSKINAEIVDCRGIEIKDLKEADEFYVKYPSNHEYKEIQILIKAKVKRVAPCIYMNNSKDYIANTYIFNEIEQKLAITFD